MVLVDIVCALVNIVVYLLMTLLFLVTCGRYDVAKMEKCSGSLYKCLFGMDMKQMVGFRRMKTCAQLTFMGLPAMILTIQIFSRLRNMPYEMLDLDLYSMDLYLMIVVVLLHAVLEGVLIFRDKNANKTDFLHQCIARFNGGFGFGLPSENAKSKQPGTNTV
jgi:hypothetical protein